MDTDLSAIVISRVYDRPIRWALIQQAVMAVLCVLMLDGGTLRKVCGIAMLGFWAGAAIFLVRRPFKPARSDLEFLRWGFLGVFWLALVMARMWSR